MVNKDLQTLIIVKTPWINDETMELFTAYCHKIKKFHMIGQLSKITRVGIESIGRNCSEIESVSIIFTDDDADQGERSVSAKKHKWTLDNQIFPALINNSSARIDKEVSYFPAQKPNLGRFYFLPSLDSKAFVGYGW